MCGRMHKGKFSCVQHLPVDDTIRKMVSNVGIFLLVPIRRITDNRASFVREMHTNLMRPPCLNLALEE